MSKFIKLKNSDSWVHEDLASIVFRSKPPEWIAPYILHIYSAGYNAGESKAKNEFNKMMEYFGENTPNHT